LILTGCHHRSTAASLTVLLALVLAPLAIRVSQASAQSSSASETETIRGTVVNSVTREPIPGALVVSPDNHFAARTDTQGRFEFTVPRADKSQPSPEETTAVVPETGGITTVGSSRPLLLSARKPGFLENGNFSTMDLAQKANEITLSLVPEAVIAGHVELPSSEAPEKIDLQLFRRVVQDGLAQWVPAGNATSKSDGDFRFANLPPGTYKLLTRELLDRDPLGSAARQQQYGYPPVYYPDATDFASAQEIELSPGETAEPLLSLVKQPYYYVKIALTNPPPAAQGMNVNVSSQKGHAGPGYALGYNSDANRIEGLLPNGTYVVDATSYGQTPAAGTMTLVVKGAPVTDASLQLLPASSISIDVKEEFTSKEPEGNATFTVYNGGKSRTFAARGPRRYLNVSLESADEFSTGRNTFLRPPSGPDDTALELDGVLPGRYWLRAHSLRGYVASVRIGATDLLHEPLVVGAGGSAGPIEITVRDDSAQISGHVEGLSPEPSGSQTHTLPGALVYCIPTPDSSGQLTVIGVSPDGSFSFPAVAPGEYRLLAFDHQQSELEYRNPEAMKPFDNQGSVVTLAAGQSEQVTLQVISTQE
jgi:hypothetical protein